MPFKNPFWTDRFASTTFGDQPPLPPPVRIELTEIDILCGSHRPFWPASGAPGRCPQRQPVSGAIATAKVELAINEAFHQPGLDPKAVKQITPQALPTKAAH